VLSDLPVDRVVCVDGPTVEQFLIAVDPLPDDAPVIVTLEVPPTIGTDPAAVVDGVLDLVEEVARAQLRAWLPSADGIVDHSDLDRRAIRRLARETATTSSHFGPFLADVAEAALLGRPVSASHDPDTRARGLAAILRTAYRRDHVALVWWTAHPMDPDTRHAAGAAAQWLAGRGLGIWTLGSGTVDSGRFSVVTLEVPAALNRPTRPATPAVMFPALSGRPHPGSAVELRFEATLAHNQWAHGRAWNHVYQPHPLTPPIRVDLMWPTERVVVELDGPDHRGMLKYADDRRRDNALTAGGYAVLRFTNDEVTDDLSRVLAMIEGLLVTRRRDEGILGENRAR
jgi:hypothetical protein